MAKSSRKGGLFFLFIIVILVIGYATNPSEEKFRLFFKEEIIKIADHEDNVVSENLLKIFSGTISNHQEIEQTDYYIFSVYKIDLSESHLVYIGAFNHFYKISD